jgi:hypothetical protein
VKNHGLYFVAFTKEPLDLVLAHVEIVLGSGRPELYFLELGSFVMLLLLVLLLALLIEIFAVVGDLADGRIRGRGNFHDIQTALTGKLHGLKRLHDAQLRALFIYHANFPRPDAFIHPDTVIRPETSLGDKPTSSRLAAKLPQRRRTPQSLGRLGGSQYSMEPLQRLNAPASDRDCFQRQ